MTAIRVLAIVAVLELAPILLAYFIGHANGVADEKANSQLLRELDAE